MFCELLFENFVEKDFTNCSQQIHFRGNFEETPFSLIQMQISSQLLFCFWFQGEVEDDPSFARKILFSDEGHCQKFVSFCTSCIINSKFGYFWKHLNWLIEKWCANLYKSISLSSWYFNVCWYERIRSLQLYFIFILHIYMRFTLYINQTYMFYQSNINLRY